MIDFDVIWQCQDEVRTKVNSSCKREQRKMCFFAERKKNRVKLNCLSGRLHLVYEL